MEFKDYNEVKMAPFRILIVDDDRYILNMLHAFFDSEGINVFCASRGREAIETFKESHFDMVITDLTMPEMDGLKVARNIRLLDQKVPIIMMTGSNLPVNTSDYGISHIFAKPFALKDLLSVVNEEKEKRRGKKAFCDVLGSGYPNHT